MCRFFSGFWAVLMFSLAAFVNTEYTNAQWSIVSQVTTPDPGSQLTVTLNTEKDYWYRYDLHEMTPNAEHRWGSGSATHPTGKNVIVGVARVSITNWTNGYGSANCHGYLFDGGKSTSPPFLWAQRDDDPFTW